MRTVAGLTLATLLGAGACVAGPGREAATPSPGKAVGLPDASAGPAGPAGKAAVGEAVRRATVRISVQGCSGRWMGSGFVLDEGTVLTNRHVVDGARTITVTAGDGTSIGVTSASESNFVDLGVVHVARTSVQGLRLADVDSPRGTTVSVVGYPLDGPLTTTGGQIAEYVVEPAISAVDPVLRLNVDLNPGNSGGPVVDGDGRVVGVAYASERSTGYGLAVPASTVRAALRDVSGLVPVAPC